MRGIGNADVIVAGGGVSGFAAAVAAGRAGADTILVEKNGIPGGVATSSLMMSFGNHMCTGDDRLVVRGLCEELLDRLAALNGTDRVWKSSKHQHITFDIEVMIPLMLDMLKEANVRVLLRSMVSDIILKGDTVQGLVVQHPGGRYFLDAKAFVDATGDGIVAIGAGEGYERENGRASLMFIMGNVDLNELYLYLKNHPEEYPEKMDHSSTFAEFEYNWLKRGVFHLPHGGGKKYSFVQDAIKRGEFKDKAGSLFGLDVFGLFGLRSNGTCLINSNFFNFDFEDPWDMSAKEIEGRESVPCLAEFCRKHMPGFQNAFVATSAREMGIRTTSKIHTRYKFTKEDKSKPVRFEDVIGAGPAITREMSEYFFYQVGDVKRPLSGQIKMPYVYQIPYRAIVPFKTKNLLVTSGRNIGDDSLRQMASCMMLGQAGGAAAKIMANTGCKNNEMDVVALQDLLRRQNVYLGE